MTWKINNRLRKLKKKKSLKKKKKFLNKSLYKKNSHLN